MTSSKKGISAHQLSRMLGLTYKSAWFLAHRIREAMRPTEFTPMGGDGETVENDETIIGKVEGAPKRITRGGSQHRNIVLTLVERGGAARSFHVDGNCRHAHSDHPHEHRARKHAAYRSGVLVSRAQR
ncbi:hypothetical protein DW352_18015 [Pseudolabrys taiwanensis]|uniref:IS1595 family transposase n=1 Tax=Pseudolabrys taiwanensis TaxID=331696 RepID=A0A345ZZA4_9HYPH|nr:hypothetical protein DW352_18015 [Pseudolabrys taiwanensis]